MARTAVRRVNEWDGPSMLKVYTPYTGTPAAPEREAPDLQAYVRRIDRYTYGLGWLGNRRRVVCRVHRENQAALAFFQAMGFVPLEGEPPEEPEKLWLAYHLRPWDPAAPKPTKPYLVEAADYEAAREKAAALVDVSGLE